MVLDGVVDRGGGEERVEAALASGIVVLGEDGLDDGALGEGFAGPGRVFAVGLEVIHVEAKDVFVFDGVGDGVGVEFALEDILGGQEGLVVAFDLPAGGVFGKDRRAGKAEELGLGEEVLDGLVGLAELGAVALVEDEDHALVAEGGELVAVLGSASLRAVLVALAVFIQGETELLDGGDDDLVGVVVRDEAADERGGVGVFFDAAFLKAVELFAGLAVQVLAVDDEEALVDVGVELEQRGGLEGGEGLARAGGVPDVAVAAVLADALVDGLDGIDLVGAHHEHLLLGGDQDHVAADGRAESALGQEGLGEVAEVSDLGVVFGGVLIDGQEVLIRIEGEVAVVVVGKVVGLGLVGNDEKLDEAEQGLGIAVSGVFFVVDDLLHGPARADAEGLEFDLDGGNAVDQQYHVVALEAVVGVDAELVDNLEGVLAPVLDVDEGVVEGGAVVAGEAVDLAEQGRGGEDVGGDDLIEEALEFAVGELDAVEGLEVVAEVVFEGGAVADVRAIDVLEVAEFRDQGLFELPFGCDHGHSGALVLLLVVITAPARIMLLCIVVGHFGEA